MNRPLSLVPCPLSLVPCVLALFLFAALIAPAAEQGTRDKGQGTDDDVQDVVLLTDARPVLVRLHVHIDGEPFRAVWNGFMRHLFEWLDVNGDGVLDPDELERAPSVDLLLARGQQGFLFAGEPADKVTARGLVEKNKGRKVTVADPAAYYGQNGLAPLQVRVGPTPVTLPPAAFGRPIPGQAPPGPRREPPSGTAVARAAFALLDTPLTLPSPPEGEGRVRGDGKLTREKLAAAPAALRRADGDDDEAVTTRERASNPPPHQLTAGPDP